LELVWGVDVAMELHQFHRPAKAALLRAALQDASRLRQLVRDLLVQYLPNGERDDDALSLLEGKRHTGWQSKQFAF